MPAIDWSDWVILSPTIIVVSSQVFLLLERLFPYDKGQKVFRNGWFNDFVMYTLVQSYVLGLVINALIQWLDHASASRLHLVGSWPVWAQLGFFFVTHDFYIYWFHRLQHRNKWLWRTHEAHHSPKEVDWLSGSRSHAVEILINQTVEYAPIVLLGAKPEVALMKGTLDAVWGMYIHSNLNVKVGPIQWIINGPEFHRWHHALEWGAWGDGYGQNYGTKLAIWDYLFGTVYRPKDKPKAYGLYVDFPDHGTNLVGWLRDYVKQHTFAFRPFADKAATGPKASGSFAAPGGDALEASGAPRADGGPS